MKKLSDKSRALVAQYAFADCTIAEIGVRLAASFARDGVTRRDAHPDVVLILCGKPEYAVDIKSTGYFKGGSAAQAAYSRVMRKAFALPSAGEAAITRVSAEERAAYEELMRAIERANAKFKKVCGKRAAAVRTAMKARAKK